MLRTSLVIPLFLITIGCSSEAADNVPAPLQTVEGTAEDAYDQALAGHPDAVSTDAADLQTTWQGFRARALKDGVAETDAKALDDGISALKTAAATVTDGPSLARTANAVSAPMSNIFAVYGPTVPAPVLELDYLGREVELDGMQSDLTAGAQDVDSLDSVWKALRAKVVAAGGSAAADAFDASIQSERDALAASDTTALTTAAHSQLDQVDVVEQVFASSDAPD
jgi:hypothetical protein